MLYLVAHSFFNGQSKNSNLFPFNTRATETQFKKDRGALGTRMSATLLCWRRSIGYLEPLVLCVFLFLLQAIRRLPSLESAIKPGKLVEGDEVIF